MARFCGIYRKRAISSVFVRGVCEQEEAINRKMTNEIEQLKGTNSQQLATHSPPHKQMD
jgi:hypothetical protein